MEGFGVHTSMWTMVGSGRAEKAVAAAAKHEMDFIEIALLNAGRRCGAYARAS